MEKEGKIINCIEAPNMRLLVAKANNLEISKEDIILFIHLGGSIYLVYYN